MEVAEKICHRVGIINKGKLVGEGTVGELRQLIRSAESSLEDIFLKVIRCYSFALTLVYPFSLGFTSLLQFFPIKLTR